MNHFLETTAALHRLAIALANLFKSRQRIANEAELDIWWDTGSIVYDPSQLISEKYDWKVVRVKDYEEAETGEK
jgi:hypothetical protein